MPDPLLEETIEEIRQILIKKDIAGFVALSSKTHIEYLAQLDPSWSCVTTVDGGIRIKAMATDFPSRENQIEALTNTVGIFTGFHSLLSNWVDNFESIIQALGKKFGIASILKEDRQGPPL